MSSIHSYDYVLRERTNSCHAILSAWFIVVAIAVFIKADIDSTRTASSRSAVSVRQATAGGS